MQRRYTTSPQALAAYVPRLVREAFGKRGFVESAILTQWSAIVGDELAANTVPEKLVFSRRAGEGAVLHVRVSGAYAIELQHLAPTVIERVNRFFGYRAVSRLALSQGPVVRDRPKPRRRGPHHAPAPVAGVSDTALGAALGRLQAAIRREEDESAG